MKGTIDIGKISEYACAAELLSRDIVPLWPSTEMYPYDLVADTGKSRHRIQVKATRAVGSVIELDLRRPPSSRKKKKYTKKDTDFLVAHVVSAKAWYVFPVEAVGGSVTVRPGRPDCKWVKYLGAWDLLD